MDNEYLEDYKNMTKEELLEELVGLGVASDRLSGREDEENHTFAIKELKQEILKRMKD